MSKTLMWEVSQKKKKKKEEDEEEKKVTLIDCVTIA